jgi:hypothetical protein
MSSVLDAWNQEAARNRRADRRENAVNLIIAAANVIGFVIFLYACVKLATLGAV